ncbi:MAG: hypothetical protein NTW86_11800, partial [Candidatus Sumerlaeota bacterium]|nr:hypothetical protein [Candidatus Sumerlaeota bacterium]
MAPFKSTIGNRQSAILLLPWAACALAGFAIYGRARAYPFLLDDTFHFAGNPTLRSWSGLWTVWTTNYWESLGQGGLYRPLLKTFWIAEFAGLGGGRGALLAVSILFHALNATLVAALAMRAGAGTALAGAAGLWFMAHAANSEVLLEAVGQGEIFSLAICLGAFLLVFPDQRLMALRGAQKLSKTASMESRLQAECGEPTRGEPAGIPPKGGTPYAPFSELNGEEHARHPAARWMGCAALLAAGLFGKEQTYAWIPVCALAVWLNRGFSRREKAYASCAMLAGLAIALAARLCVLRGFGPEGVYQLGAELSWLQRLTLAVYLFGRYVMLALAPWRLSPDYTWLGLELPMRWNDPFVLTGVAAGALCFAGLAGAIWRKKRDWLLLSLAALAPLAPVLGLRPIGTLFAERHAYHPLAGAAALLAVAIHAAARFPPRAVLKRRALTLLILAWAGLNAVVAFLQVGAWRSGEALWGMTLERHPRSYFAAANLAYYQMTQGRFADARSSAETALRIAPDFADAHVTLGE